MFSFSNKTIIILSPEDWGKNQLSKHHYAKELSKNNLVYFVHTSPHYTQKEFIEISTIAPNLNLVHLKNVVKGVTKLPSYLIDIQNKYIIFKLLKAIGNPKIDILWSFDQSKFQNLKQFKATYSIFHPVDYIVKAATFKNRIADSANLVLSVSQPILDTIQTKTPKHFINHGLDDIFHLKNKPLEKPIYIKPDAINVGYVGNLQMRLIDYENLIKTVRENPTINFVFIGPDKISNLGGKTKFKEVDTLKSFQNTHFTGELSKPELVNILPFFDIFWLCYNHDKFPVEVSNSHKILEYLSTGKVVVSNFISSYYNSNLIELLSENMLISKKIKEVSQEITLYNTPEKKQARINFAKENTYKKQLERIEVILSAL